MTYHYHPPAKVEQHLKMPKAVANRDPVTGQYTKMEDLEVERGDIIWMINKVGPVSGHVSTIIQSIDASGDKKKMPAMVTWVCGNGGGAPRGTVRVQTVWRVACPNPNYDYDEISKLGNQRDTKRDAYNQATSDPKEKIVGKGDALGSSSVPKAVADKEQVQGVVAADDRLKKEAEKAGSIRPDVAGTHWQVVLFKTSRFGFVKLADEYGRLTGDWLGKRRATDGKITESPPSDDEKKLLDEKNDELRPRLLMWTPPGCNRQAILIKAKSEIDAKNPELVKLLPKKKG